MSEFKQFRVIGPPGCGKTTFLSRQVARAAGSYGAGNVAVVSLTNASANRVVEKAVEDKLPIPPENIGTLHSFCFRAIGGKKVAEKKLDEWNTHVESRFAWMKLTDPGGGDDIAISRGKTPADAIFQMMNILRAKMIPPELFEPRIKDLWTEWTRWKQDTGYIDFTDMLEIGLRDVEKCPGDPAALFVDEAQDFSRLAWSVVRKWGEQCITFVTVGDPDQLLYGWAGSEVEAFYQPALPPEQTRVLSQSYRVPEAVHERAVAWIEQTPGREPIKYQPTSKRGEVIDRWDCSIKYPDSFLDEVHKYTEEGKTVGIVASCAYLLNPTMSALRSAGVPFWNPYAPERGEFNPLYRNGVTAADRLRSFLKASMDEVWTWQDLHNFIDWMDAKVLLRGAKTQVREAAEDPQIGHLPIEKNFFEMVSEKSPLYGVAESKNLVEMLDGNVNWLIQNTLPTHRKSYEYPARILNTGGLELLNSQPKVIISTIHACKGGEMDVCYLFPDLSPAGANGWNKAAGSEEREEIRRGFYVGMTRAKEKLILGNASGGMAVNW